MLFNKKRQTPVSSKQRLEELMQDASPEYKRKALFRQWRNVALKIIFLIACIIGLVYGAQYLWIELVKENKDFQLQEIIVHTNGQMTEEQIRKLLHITGNENVLSLDSGNYAERLRTRPDIIKVSVEKRLPSSLVIELEERHPIAWLDCPASDIYPHDIQNGLFLDSFGYTFRYDASLHAQFKACPVITVPPPVKGKYKEGEWIQDLPTQRALALIQEATALSAEGMPPLEYLDFPTNWCMFGKFSNGMEITFDLYEEERQLGDLLLLMQYASDTNRKLFRANLIPKKNIPVFFASDSPAGSEGQEAPQVEVIIEIGPEPEPSPLPLVNTPARQSNNTQAGSDNNKTNTSTNTPKQRQSSSDTPRRNTQTASGSSASRNASSTASKPKARKITGEKPSTRSKNSTNQQQPSNSARPKEKQNPPPRQQQQPKAPEKKKPVEVPTFHF